MTVFDDFVQGLLEKRRREVAELPPDLTTGAGQVAATYDKQQVMGSYGTLTSPYNPWQAERPADYVAPPSYWRDLDRRQGNQGAWLVGGGGGGGGDVDTQAKLRQAQHDKFLEGLSAREQSAGRLSKPNQAKLQSLRGRYAALAEEASEQVGHVSTQQLHLGTQSLAHEFNATNWDQGQGHPPNSKVVLEDGSTAMTDGNSQVIGSSIISKDNITDDGRGGYYVYDGKTQSQTHHTAQEIAKNAAELAASAAKVDEAKQKALTDLTADHERILNNAQAVINKKTGKTSTPEMLADNHLLAMARAHRDINIGKELGPLAEELDPEEAVRIYKANQASKIKTLKAEADEEVKPKKLAAEQQQKQVDEDLDAAQEEIDTQTENNEKLSYVQGRQAKELATAKNTWDEERIRAKFWTTDPDYTLLREAAREVPGTGQERLRNLAQMEYGSVVLMDGEAVVKVKAPTPLGYELYPLVDNIDEVLAAEDAGTAKPTQISGMLGPRPKSTTAKPRGLF